MQTPWEEFCEDLVFFARTVLGASCALVVLTGLTLMIGG